VADIPGKPFRGKDAPARAYEHLRLFHGVDPRAARIRLHAIKSRHWVGPTERVVIGKTGDVWRESDGEHLGYLIEGGT
jgi:hypothetical protein